jgi:hypothetical protein
MCVCDPARVTARENRREKLQSDGTTDDGITVPKHLMDK